MFFTIKMEPEISTDALRERLFWADVSISNCEEKILVQGDISYPAFLNVLYICQLVTKGRIEVEEEKK